MTEKKQKKKPVPMRERMAKLGLTKDWDYVLHMPIRYENKTRITPIGELVDGSEALIEAVVIQSNYNSFRHTFTGIVEDDSGEIEIFFLHAYPTYKQTLEVGKRLRFFGKVSKAQKGSGLVMIHPEMTSRAKFSDLPKTLTPIYGIGQNVTQTWIRTQIRQALLNVDVKDLLTEKELKELDLPRLPVAIKKLHYPDVDADVFALQTRTSPEWNRIKFDELFAQQLMLRLSRQNREVTNGPQIRVPENKKETYTYKLYRSLPFKLTAAQRRVWREILDSLSGPRPMNRLLQGDVGSGKTIVAAMTATMVIDNGWQVAFMAPTEILAQQHFYKIIEWLKPLGVKIAWLVGGIPTKEKRETLQRIKDGEIDIIVGTHALIQQSVVYKKLGLAIVDEQHRFGVEQRLALMSRTTENVIPHLLMLSATPIPRTLAMSYMADVDVSIIDELPPGRKPITTRTYLLDRKANVAKTLQAELRNGKQAYWVCPLIEESEKIDLTAAEETYLYLRDFLRGLNVDLLHGKMSPQAKEAAMEKFKNGETSLLVSTTVIEVGVDVPNATIMVIEHAERFGLSQLHQLRGRVGRGSDKSYCIALFADNLSEVGKERLKIFRETQDGFKIAQRDLELRGPGEFLGARQSGVPLLRFADIHNDTQLVQKAIKLADKWIKEKDPRAQEHAKRWYENRGNYLTA